LLSGLFNNRPEATTLIENSRYVATDNGDAEYVVIYITPGDISTAQWFLITGGNAGVVLLQGLHGDRPSATSLFENSRYIETDRGESEYTVRYLTPNVSASAVWVYLQGHMKGYLRLVDEKPNDLGSYDKGFLFESIDFHRSYEWSGTAWYDAPGNEGRGVYFKLTTPVLNGWHLCDGTTDVATSNEDGSTSLIDVPDMISSGGVYPKGSSSYSGPTPTPATAPTISGTTTSSNGDHNHPSSTADASHVHAFTPTGTVTGNLPDHNHSFNSTFCSTNDDITIAEFGGADWVITGDIGGDFSGLSVTGNMPQHTHTLASEVGSGGGVGVSEAVLADGTTDWHVTGTIGGSLSIGGSASITGDVVVTADLPQHIHGLSELTDRPFTTSDESNTHTHADGTLIASSPTATNVALVGGSTDFDLASASFNVSGNTSINSEGHSHTGELGFSDAFTDLNDVGTAIDFTVDSSGLGVDTSGLSVTGTPTFTDTSVSHYHRIGGHTDGVVDDPVALFLSVSGDASGLTFNDTSVKHFHGVFGITQGISGTIPLADLEFTGIETNTEDANPALNALSLDITTDGAHTHSVTGITSGTDGEPRRMGLLPFLRL
jgi:hypothetical protein